MRTRKVEEAQVRTKKGRRQCTMDGEQGSDGEDGCV
jgi:hypothetical protein